MVGALNNTYMSSSNTNSVNITKPKTSQSKSKGTDSDLIYIKYELNRFQPSI